ncbi:MAG: RNA polymerase sigma factor [Acidimicrobiales bacterium]
MAAAAVGVGPAWDELVRRYGRLVWAVTRANGLGPADAADVCQVAWLRLADHLGTLRDPEKVGSWLATTTRFECFRTIRRRDRETPVPGFEADDYPGRAPDGPAGLRRPSGAPGLIGRGSGAEDDDPADAIHRADRAAALARVVATLPERHQALLRLLMLDPAPSYQEISDALGMPVGSIGPTRQRILAVLRGRCQAAGLTVDGD